MPNTVLSISVQDHGIFWETRTQKQKDGNYVKEQRCDVNNLPKFDPQRLAEKIVAPLVETQRWLDDLLVKKELNAARRNQLAAHVEILAMLVGQHLYALIFHGEIHNFLRDHLGNSKKDGLLRVELEFTGKQKEFSAWPWEYLYIPHDEGRTNTGEFLARMADLVLTRKLTILGAASRDLLTSEKVRVLFIRAQPHGMPPVECAKVRELLTTLSDSDVIELAVELVEPPETDPLPAGQKPVATVSAFKAAVAAHQPHVIHFVGHGSFDNDLGKLSFVGDDFGESLCDKFDEIAAQSKNLKLVFLQACDSALADPRRLISGVANACANRGVPAVIAMQAKIENSAADAFAVRFYTELKNRQPLDFAVMRGLEAVRELSGTQARSMAFGIPVLFLRSDDDQARLILPGRAVEAQGGAVFSPGIAAPEKMCFCPNCQFKNPWDQMLCDKCNAELACPRCKVKFDREKPGGGRRPNCTKCGELMPGDVPAVMAADLSDESTRRGARPRASAKDVPQPKGQTP